MPRTAATVKQADIARALRAAKHTDLKMALEILPNGSIRLVPIEKEASMEPQNEHAAHERQRPIL